MGKDYLGKDQRSRDIVEDEKEEKEIKSLDEGDIKLLKSYGQGPYSKSLKQVETDIADTIKRVNELAGIKVRIFLVLFNPFFFSNCHKVRKDYLHPRTGLFSSIVFSFCLHSYVSIEIKRFMYGNAISCSDLLSETEGQSKIPLIKM